MWSLHRERDSAESYSARGEVISEAPFGVGQRVHGLRLFATPTFLFRSQSSFTMYLTRFGGQFIRVQSPFRVYLTHFGASEPSVSQFNLSPRTLCPTPLGSRECGQYIEKERRLAPILHMGRFFLRRFPDTLSNGYNTPPSWAEKSLRPL